jgi:GDP-4-dehydro-6-deoxy-D-mannose reductase
MGGKSMSQQPRLLITGASGFTGEHACNYFLGRGYEITAVTRKHFSNKDYAVKIEYCELTNKNEVTQLIKKVKPDFILHLAGLNHVGDSWKDPIATLETNFLSTLYIIETTRQHNPNCRIVIVGSALQSNPNEISNLSHPYSLSKTLQVLISQAWEKLYKLNIVIAKPSNLIGPGPSNGVNSIFANKIVQMESNQLDPFLEVSNLNTTRDFIDVRDAVSAYDVLLNKGESGEVYEISSGKRYSLGEIIQMYKNLTDVDFKVQTFSNEIDPQVEEVKPLKMYELGWRPKHSIDSSIEDTLHYFRRNKKH